MRTSAISCRSTRFCAAAGTAARHTTRESRAIRYLVINHPGDFAPGPPAASLAGPRRPTPLRRLARSRSLVLDVRVRGDGNLFRRQHEMRPAILRPRILIVTRIEREFLAVTHGLEAIGRDAEREQVALGRERAPIP